MLWPCVSATTEDPPQIVDVTGVIVAVPDPSYSTVVIQSLPKPEKSYHAGRVTATFPELLSATSLNWSAVAWTV